MKKLTIMLEDKFLIPWSEPAPHGLQKQFPSSKRLLISLIGSGFGGSTLRLGAAISTSSSGSGVAWMELFRHG